MKVFFSLLLLGAVAFANSLHYDIKAPLLGKEGAVDINYYHTATRYSMHLKFFTTGMAKKLTGNRRGEYSSKGFVDSNKYKAKIYKDNISYKNKKREHQYLFNYTTKKITKTTKAWRDGKLVKNDKRVLSYFTYNDFLNSYHNIVAHLKHKPAGYYQMKVAGMEKYGEYLKVYIPPKAQQKKEAKELGTKDVWIFHLFTKRKILGSKSGEMIFAVGEDGIAKVVRVLDIPFVSYLDAVLR